MADAKSTVFDTISQLTANNVNQLFTYNEGDANVDFPGAITFTNLYGYTDNITVTFTFSGGDATFVELVSTNEVATIIKDSDSVYRIESTYTKDGISQNVWADLTTTLSALRLEFNNSDASDDYTIAVAVTNGTDTVNGTITVNGFAVIDADNIVQNVNIAEDDWANLLPTAPQISDADEAGKTYRVTITSPSSSEFILFGTEAYNVGPTRYVPELVYEGTQDQINESLINNLYFLTGPDLDVGTYTVTYTQEVISGATGVPYTQETGQFNFTVTSNDSADTAVSNINYTEDTPTDISIATINDTRGVKMNASSKRPYYHATITLADPNAGSIVGWIDEGSGVYTLTSLNTSSEEMQAALDHLVFLPATDYKSNTSLTFKLERDHQKGDVNWYDGSTNKETLIADTVITLTATADTGGGYVFGTGPYDWETDVATDVSSLLNITDRRGDYGTVTYRVYVTLDAPATTTNGEFRTFGSGGTSTWNGTSHRLEVEGTKTEVNSHLANMQWWSRGPSDSFTIDITVDRNIESAGYVNVATSNDIVFNTGTAPSNNLQYDRIYNEDEDSSFDDDTKGV